MIGETLETSLSTIDINKGPVTQNFNDIYNNHLRAILIERNPGLVACKLLHDLPDRRGVDLAGLRRREVLQVHSGPRVEAPKGLDRVALALLVPAHLDEVVRVERAGD